VKHFAGAKAVNLREIFTPIRHGWGQQQHGVTQRNGSFQAAANNALLRVTVSAPSETCFSFTGRLKCAPRAVCSFAARRADLLVRGERAMLVEIARFFSYLIRFSDDFAYENQKKSLTSS
jgi:hypothetical protein